ncbi:hypothetical protein PanWU01x14_308010 [Parasponia andersonii]|uniref:Uncharacterized protein n=1 Tax=Parasponia andersonii TaxID=3476 RepID=A0A2P5ARF3_PARAD|nr:hypothetical protein PanWU01x14_308010 [Parasponia andersonii]
MVSMTRRESGWWRMLRRIWKLSLNSCWKSAYRHLFSGCSEGLAVDEKRSRFAWHLSDCFQKDSGRPPFPSCDPKSSMAKCLKVSNEYEHKVYLEFCLETNSICHQLQLRMLFFELVILIILSFLLLFKRKTCKSYCVLAIFQGSCLLGLYP